MKDYYLAYPQLKDYLFRGYRFIENKNYPATEDKIVFVHDVGDGYKSNESQVLRKKTKELIHLYIDPEKIFTSVKDIKISETRFDKVLEDWEHFINHFVEFYGYSALKKDLEEYDLSRKDLTTFVKESFALGKFSKEAFKTDRKKMYYVFESFNQEKSKFVEQYLRSSKEFEDNEILAGLIQFFDRSENFDQHRLQVNDYYKNILEKASYNEKRVTRFLDNYLNMCDNIDHRLRVVASFL